MAFDGFLKLTDIPGESKDATHTGEIDIVSWNFGMTQPGSANMSGGGGVAKINFQDLSITKNVDKATPILMLRCADGTAIPEGILVVRKAGGEQLEYLTLTLSDIIITSVSEGGAGGDDALVESVSLNFAKVVVKYVEQATDGSGLGPVEFGWDIEGNIPVA